MAVEGMNRECDSRVTGDSCCDCGEVRVLGPFRRPTFSELGNWPAPQDVARSWCVSHLTPADVLTKVLVEYNVKVVW